MVLEKTLERSLDCKEIKPVNPIGNQPWIFIGRTDAEAETPILWPPDAKNWLIGKDPMLGKIEGKRRRKWQRMRWLHGITDSMNMSLSRLRSWWWTRSAGVLQSVGLQRVGHDWASALNWVCIYQCCSPSSSHPPLPVCVHMSILYLHLYFCSANNILVLIRFHQFSRSVVSNSFWPHEPQHARHPCPSPSPGVHPHPCPLCQWCHPTISSSAIPFSSCLQSFPASGSFQMSQLFTSGGQSIGVSASTSVLPMNTQDWSPLGWTVWISLQSKGLSRVFSNTTLQKHQFFGAKLSSQSNSHIHTWPLEKP